jgi:hypothetical protein
LRLLAGKYLKAKEWLADLGAQVGHRAPHLNDAVGIAAIASHLVNASGAQPWMLVQGLADKFGVGIDNGRTQRPWVTEAFGLDSVACRIRVDDEFTGDGTDCPMLGIEVAANLRTGFGADHQ